MASLFKNHLPDWEAPLPPRGNHHGHLSARKWAGQGDQPTDNAAIGAPLFVPINVAGPYDRANRVIGRICVAITIVILAMMAAQFLRSHLAGVL